jgi:hypothetical protein
LPAGKTFVDHSCASDRAKARNNTHEAVRKLAPNSKIKRENGGLWTETRLAAWRYKQGLGARPAGLSVLFRRHHRSYSIYKAGRWTVYLGNVGWNAEVVNGEIY